MLILVLVIFAPLAVAGMFGAMLLLDGLLEWQCERCLRDQPDNPFCCE